MFVAMAIVALFNLVMFLIKNEIFMIGDTATDKKFADNACVPFVFVGNDTEIGEKSAYSADNAGLATELILNLL